MDAGAAELETAPVERLRLAFWDGSSPDSLTLALSPPVVQCVELGLEGRLKTPRHRVVGQLRLLISTKSAYRCRVSRGFLEAIEKRTAISRDLHDRIYTAIQEAVMNGVLHGNLRIDSGARESLDGLMEIHATIEHQLARPEVARGMIQLDALWSEKTLYVIVRDCGAGYRRGQLAAPMGRNGSPVSSHGRGLSILEALCDRVALIQGGAVIRLGFRL